MLAAAAARYTSVVLTGTILSCPPAPGLRKSPRFSAVVMPEAGRPAAEREEPARTGLHRGIREQDVTMTPPRSWRPLSHARIR
jgi:hypothetical protein